MAAAQVAFRNTKSFVSQSNSRFSSQNFWDTVPLAGQSQNTVNAGFSYSF